MCISKLAITGQRFGRLVAVKRVIDPKKRSSIWEFLCDCGQLIIRRAYPILDGDTKSCGCLKKETSQKLGLRNNWCKGLDRSQWRLKRTHGMSKTSIYRIWIGMRQRCCNPKNAHYGYYGKRGIKILWKSFEEFRDDMFSSYNEHAEKYGSRETTIERMDVNGHYSKENCRWATRKEQANNTRINCLYTFQGKTMSVLDWSKEKNIRQTMLYSRLNKLGWNIEKSLTEPRHRLN